MKVFEVTKTKEQLQTDIDTMFRNHMNNAQKQGITVSPEQEQQIRDKIKHNVLSGSDTRDRVSQSNISSDDAEQVGSHLNSIRNIDFKDGDDEWGQQMKDTGKSTEREQLGAEPVDPADPTTLPAIISKELQSAGQRNVEFMKLTDLPGMSENQIRMMGNKIFRHFTNTNVNDIVVAANFNGSQQPNEMADINAVSGYAKNNGQEIADAQLMFDKAIPGYDAEVKMYETSSTTYMLVKDFMGSYIYAWPRNQTKRLTNVKESYTYNPTGAMVALFRTSTSIRRNLMKVNEILEMSDDDIRGDTGEKPVRALSPEMEKRKKLDQEAIRVRRNMSTRAKGSRLRGRGRGTAQADQSMIQK